MSATLLDSWLLPYMALLATWYSQLDPDIQECAEQLFKDA